MPWKISTRKPRSEAVMPPSAENKWETFKAKVNSGMHPRQAAEEAGDMNYTKLRGADQYEVRLSGKHRATFQVDETNEEVIVLEVGGHT
ncbi:MAG TPA: hypothetical protein VHL54_03710 [Actinomycetota bacterium]|nr:hypothetical protein [Actinomycetota bacterium]